MLRVNTILVLQMIKLHDTVRHFLRDEVILNLLKDVNALMDFVSYPKMNTRNCLKMKNE